MSTSKVWQLHTVIPRQIVPTEIRTLQRTVPGFSGTASRESNGKKSKKRIKNKVSSVLQEFPNVLPDNAQGTAEDSNPIPYSLGRRLGPLPY